MKLNSIQKYLQENNLSGWLLADFHGYNTVFMELLGIDSMLTRRSFFYIPAKGDATAIVHAIEQDRFKSLEACLITYSSYSQFESELCKLVGKGERIAMEYSPSGRLPYIAKVDAGTIELVRCAGAEIVSSADLVSYFQTRLDTKQIASHRLAASNLFEIKDKAFAFISERLKKKKGVTEFEVSQFMLQQFDDYGMETDHPPNCSFAANAGKPHYEPSAEKTANLKEGEIVLIDLWAKLKGENSVFADICWIAYAGSEIPNKFEKLFSVISTARDNAIQFLRENIENRPVYGYEVDDISRQSVVADGYGVNFTHRTGHSIMTSVHGNGPNIDNLETEDRRVLMEGHLFSIEPGIYFDDCGMRTEVDVLVLENGIEINPAPVQNEIVQLL